MTLQDAEIIFDGWKAMPPPHHLLQILARAWGWKGPQLAASASIESEGRPDGLIAFAQVPGLPVGAPVRDPGSVFDIAEARRKYAALKRQQAERRSAR